MSDTHPLLCAVSPLCPLRVSDAWADDGFASLGDCPIPADAAGFPGGHGVRDDEYVDTDDEGVLFAPRVFLRQRNHYRKTSHATT